MNLKVKFVVSAILLGLLCLMVPGSIRADTVNINSVNTNSSPFSVDISTTKLLAQYGITLANVTPGTTVFVACGECGGNSIVSSSPPNVLIQLGNDNGMSYTLLFSTPLSTLSFTLAGNSKSGGSGTLVAGWSATAFDASGNVVSSVGDPSLFGTFSPFPPQPFTLAGPGIASVTFFTQCFNVCGTGLNIADLSAPEIKAVSSCQVSDLAPVTDPVALRFEAAAPDTPQFSLFPPDVSVALDQAMTGLQDDMATLFGVALTRTSGFRPLAYQAHLYELRTKLKSVQDAIQTDPNQETACADLLAKLNNEIDNIHGLRRDPTTELPLVNPPSASAHTINPAQAIDVSLSGLTTTQISELDGRAELNDLTRACRGDSIHFTLIGTPCSRVIRVKAQSPVALLMQDPQGRKVGFDPQTQTIVNEIGTAASYTGPKSEPQFLDIGGTIPGAYTLTAVGTAAGPFTLTIEELDEDSATLATQVQQGMISPGQVISLIVDIPVAVTIEISPGKRPHKVELNRHQDISVAILSSPIFSAPERIDTSSLTFGSRGDEKTLDRCKPFGEDVNDDGLPDLVCRFDVDGADFLPQSTQGVLKGRTKDGVAVEGVASIKVVAAGHDSDDHEDADRGSQGRERSSRSQP